MKTFKLTQEFKIQIEGEVEVFIGREPKSISSSRKTALKKQGLVEDHGESGEVRYSAPVFFQMKDGRMYEVDSEGNFDINFDALDDDEKNTITSLADEIA